MADKKPVPVGTAPQVENPELENLKIREAVQLDKIKFLDAQDRRTHDTQGFDLTGARQRAVQQLAEIRKLIQECQSRKAPPITSR